MANAPSNISDFSNLESTFTAFHRAHPEQQDNFNRKMNETAAEFCELALPVHMANSELRANESKSRRALISEVLSWSP